MARAAVSQTPPSTDDRAFAAFLQLAQPRALRLLRRLCPLDAEDVLQETLAKVWRLRHAFDPRQDGEAWLLQAAFRTFCDHRARRRPGTDQDAVQRAEAPPRPCRLELQDEVRACLAGLPAIERTLLLGFHRDGHSLQQLAAHHGLPLNTVKSHLHRARARLAASRGAADDAR